MIPAAISPRSRANLRRRLLAWYDRNRRALPWRRTRDPYRVWISEVMLQQTRVAAARPYYRRFLRRFPTVQSLAAARAEEVVALWSGLGYYRRARQLHAAARVVVRNRGGVLPPTAAELITLPGIGRYTAAAVASIAHAEPVAVVDGNVRRVLRRIFRHAQGITKNDPWQQAQWLLDPRRPGDFNQAMMELGATVCLPATPACSACPVVRWCGSRGVEEDSALGPPRRRRAQLRVALAQRPGKVYLVRRAATEGQMPGMWELPAASSLAHLRRPQFQLRHSITTTDYDVSVYLERAGGRDGRWVQLQKLAEMPLTGLTRKILRRAGLMAHPSDEGTATRRRKQLCLH